MSDAVLLAIDTSAERPSAAVRHADGRLVVVEGEGRAGALLHGLVSTVLAQAGTTLDRVDLLAAVRGPGSFTGLRVGIAAVHGLALATGRRAVGVGTTRAVAAASGLSGPVTVVLDGGQGRLFVASHVVEGDGVATTLEPFDATTEEALQALGPHPALLRGAPPSAAALIAAGCARFEAPLAGAAARLAAAGGGEPLEPLYARAPAIRPPRPA